MIDELIYEDKIDASNEILIKYHKFKSSLYEKLCESNIKQFVNERTNYFSESMSLFSQRLEEKVDVTGKVSEILCNILSDIHPAVAYLENDFAMFHHNESLYLSTRKLENVIITMINTIEQYDFQTLCELVKKEN